MIGPMDERSLLDTSSVFGMSSPGTSSMPGKRERCSQDANSAFSLSCLGTGSVSGTIAQLPILWGAPQCGLQRPPWYGTVAGLSHIGMVSLDMM